MSKAVAREDPLAINDLDVAFKLQFNRVGNKTKLQLKIVSKQLSSIAC